MFGFPSMYEAPRRYAQPQRQSYDPFGFGGYSQPPHRPQAHTSFRNPYGYQYDPRYYNTEDDESDEEEEYYPQQQKPQQQVRLDQHPQYHNLSPQERLYLQQLQQQKQRQQQQEQLRQQQQRQQQQQQHKQEQQKKQHHTRQQSSQQQPRQQQTQHIPVQQKKVDLDKEALKIQRLYRAWNVRRYDILTKLRTINKIEAEVDAITETPINKHILSLNPSEPLPTDLDTSYVGKVPRNVMLLEHELTAKLLSLDGISGASEIVRPRRKGLVNKIEGILSKIDALKKVYATMTPPPAPTPSISNADESTSTPTPAADASSTSTPSTSLPVDKKKDTEESAPSVTEVDGPSVSDGSNDTTPTETVNLTTEPETTSNLSQQLDSLNIQDVSEPTPTTAAPSISTPSTLPSSSTPTNNQIPSLKQMCYNLCDSMIKRNLVVPLQVN